MSATVSTPKKRLTILMTNLKFGGVERVRFQLARAFKNNGYEVSFAVLESSGELYEAVESEFNLENLDCHRLRSLFLPLGKYLKTERPDVLLVSMWPLTVLAPVTARIVGFKGKVIVSEHCSLKAQYVDAFKRPLSRMFFRLSMAVGYRLADHVVCVSQGVCKEICELAYLNSDRVCVIHNPLIRLSGHVDSIEIAKADASWRSLGNGYRLLFVGELKRQKNPRLLLDALALLDIESFVCLFVGDGALLDQMREYSAELGIANRVAFVGFRMDPAAFYMTADLLVLPSDYEGFGNVIVEALSYGLRVVSTDCEHGPREILNSPDLGSLCLVGDAVSLSNEIKTVIGKPISVNACIARSEEFSINHVARKYLTLL